MEYIEKNWKKLLAYTLITILIIGGVWWFFHWQQQQQEILHQAQNVTQEQTKSIKDLQEKLQISNENASMLAKRIGEIQAPGSTIKPNVTFTVEAPNVQTAADDVRERINNGDTTLPDAAIEQTDRTVVTPVTKDSKGNELKPADKKVDVYKINLRKDHRIKVGATVIDGHAYGTVGYEQGRFEALVHTDGTKTGGSVMYNVAEW